MTSADGPSSRQPVPVFCPYTDLHPLCDAALTRHAPHAERVRIETNHREGYWRFLAARWAAGTGWLNVEHDIEINEHVVPSIETCPHPWCVFPYLGPSTDVPNTNYMTRALGCTRFSAELCQKHPDAISAIGEISDGLPPRDWRRCDTLLQVHLTQAGYEPHEHYPPVLHHHFYPVMGCACGEAHE